MDLNEFPLMFVFAASILIFVFAAELGRRLSRGADRESQSNISTLVGSMLGLMALMLGFTFSLALSRFEARRDAVLTEANAIGTAALRARLLPAPHNSESVKLLREYVQIRLQAARARTSPLDLKPTIARSSAIQEALYQQAKAVAARDNALVPTGLFIQALNEMIDNHEKRLTAAVSTVPDIVLIVLYGVAIVTIGFVGYSSGPAPSRARLPIYTVVLLVSVVLLLIQDLDRPSAGFVTASQQPMINAAATIASFPD